MLKTAQPQSDLMAMLAGQGKVSSQNAKNGGDVAGLAELLENAGKGQNQFSDILAGEGAMQEISQEELLQFFQGKTGEGVSEESLKKVLAGMDPSQLQKMSASELEGLMAEAEAMTQMNEGVSHKSEKSTEDFLAMKQSLQGKGMKAQLLGNRQAISKDGKIRLQNLNPALRHYQKENKIIDNKLVKIPQNNFKVEELGDSDRLFTMNGSKKAMSSTEMMESEATQQGTNSDLAQILAMKEKGSSDLSQGRQDGQMNGLMKTIDLSHIQAGNKAELINQVSNYIEQSYVAGQDSIDLVVKHEELGQFRINAQKVGVGNQVDLEIQTMTKAGQQFFAENESELIKNLTQSGIKLSDLKIVGQKEFFAMSEGSSKNMDSQGQNQGRGEFMGDSGRRGQGQSHSRGDQGRDRRQQMWQMAQESMMSA